MFQRFHDESQLGRFVKNLLSTEPIPLLQVVDTGSHIIEGCNYIYSNYVIRCLKSGVLGSGAQFTYASSGISTTSYTSKVSWYDGDTHKYLGNYLRYLRDSRSVDLMRYYNCYNATELTDVYLAVGGLETIVCSDDLDPDPSVIDPDTEKRLPKMRPNDSLLCGAQKAKNNSTKYSFGSLSGNRVVAVPIRFDTTYTIAIDCYEPLSLMGVIYNQTGMVKTCDNKGYYSDYLEYSHKILSNSSFQKPFTYKVELENREGISLDMKQQLYTRQKDLYLLIQIPTTVTSSIVVLEGDYTQKHVEIGNPGYREYNDKGEVIYRSNVLTSIVSCTPNLSLLNYNTGVSYAFSDRLVEYLLLNVVTSLETLPGNIARVQQSLRKLYPSYFDRIQSKSALLGVWDDNIQNYITDLVFNNQNKIEYPYDHDGYINKDVERLLSLKGVYVT